MTDRDPYAGAAEEAATKVLTAHGECPCDGLGLTVLHAALDAVTAARPLIEADARAVGERAGYERARTEIAEAFERFAADADTASKAATELPEIKYHGTRRAAFVLAAEIAAGGGDRDV